MTNRTNLIPMSAYQDEDVFIRMCQGKEKAHRRDVRRKQEKRKAIVRRVAIDVLAILTGTAILSSLFIFGF